MAILGAICRLIFLVFFTFQVIRYFTGVKTPLDNTNTHVNYYQYIFHDCRILMNERYKMSNSVIFGEKLRDALKSANLTQKDAANKLGISPGSMTNYVHGRVPEAEILLSISRLCNKSMEWFLSEQEFIPKTVQYEKDNQEIRTRIRDAMAWNGMTAEDLADAMEITGEEAHSISEGLLANPGLAVDLCRILDVTSDWLFNGRGEGPPYWGEFINIQYGFFSALAKFISHIILIDKQDIQQVVAGKIPAESLIPQNGVKR